MSRANTLPPTLAPIGLSRIEAAAYIGVSPTLFDAMVEDGRMPRPKKANTRKIWIADYLRAALANLPSDDENADESGGWDDFAKA
jgi:hypothetical protein